MLNPRVCFKSIHQNTAININNFAYPNTSRWKLLLLLWSVFWYVKNRWPEVSKRQHLSSKPQWRSNRAACVSRAFQTSDFYLHEGLFSCSFGIRRVPRFQVSCGQDHSLFLTESGKVFACGWGADGQTGWCASGRQNTTVRCTYDTTNISGPQRNSLLFPFLYYWRVWFLFLINNLSVFPPLSTGICRQ